MDVVQRDVEMIPPDNDRENLGPKRNGFGRKLIVTIGIDSYQHLPVLHNAANDAKAVQNYFVNILDYEALYPPLLNGKATQKAITALLLNQLRQALEPNDTLVLFFAGHGMVRQESRGEDIGFLAPVDGKPEAWNSLIRMDTLLDELGRLPALHVLVIIDTCFSGHALGGTFTQHIKAGDGNRAASRRVLTSARANQLALDGSRQQANSPFTAILLDAFRIELNEDVARADFDKNGMIIGIELGLFVQLEFGKKTQHTQMPDFGVFHYDERGEFTVATRGNRQLRDDPELLIHLQAAQRWLQNKGDHQFLYQRKQLADATAWRIKQDDADVRDEIDAFLKSSKQHWRWQLILAMLSIL